MFNTKLRRVISTEAITNEPPHDKTNNMAVRPVKTQLSLGMPSLIRVFVVRMKKAWVLSYPLRPQ